MSETVITEALAEFNRLHNRELECTLISVYSCVIADDTALAEHLFEYILDYLVITHAEL